MGGLATGLPSATNVQARAIAASAQLYAGPGMLISATWGETTGSAGAVWYLHDGQDATGELVAVIALNSGGGGGTDPGLPGPEFRNGLYLERVSGTISFVGWFLPRWNQAPQ